MTDSLYRPEDERGEPSAGRSAPPGPEDDPEAKARALCLRLLTSAPRTRAQLEQALLRRGIDTDTAESVLGRFSAVGVIDDAAFAEAWVDSRHAGRGLGKRALAAELRSRGVDEEIVRDAVEEVAPEQEEATARRLVQRRLATTRGKDPDVRARRAISMLARKGYPAGLAFRLVREELEAEGSGIDLVDPELD